MVTLQDIADRVGVTRTVASYVLANRLGKIRVSEAKRLAILRVAKELGYVPNRSARALITRKNRAIGLILNHRRFEEPTVGEFAVTFNILEGMRTVGDQSDYQCLHAGADLQSSATFEMPRFLEERSVDAVALYGYVHSDIAKRILKTGLPCLHIGTNLGGDLGISNIFAEMDRAACRAVDEAVAAGIRSVHLYLPSGPGPEKIAQTFLQHAKTRHPRVKTTARLGKGSSLTYEDAARHGTELAERMRPPELIFTSIADHLPLYVGLKAGGLRCPDDVQLLAFAPQGHHQVRLGESGLSVAQIVLPYTTLGEVVSRQLIELLEQKRSTLEDASVDCLFHPGETAPAFRKTMELQTHLPSSL